MIIARMVETTVGAALLYLILRRYADPRTVLVPLDLVLWTLTIFLVAPLVVDGLGLTATYRLFPEIEHATSNAVVRLVAAVLVGYAATVCLLFVRSGARHRPAAPGRLPPGAHSSWPWLLVAFLPIVTVMLAPEPGVYRSFAANVSLRGPGGEFADLSGPVARFHVYVMWSTYVSSLGLAMWFAARDLASRRWLTVAAVAVITIMDFWLNGKRHILALIAIQLVFVRFVGRPISRSQRRRLLGWSAAGGAVVLAVSLGYQREFRPGISAGSTAYESLRVDYDRVGVLRLSVDRQLHPAEPQIVDYPGQSLVLHAAALVGAADAHTKAVTYADRVDSIARGLPVADRGGGITTSVVTELIDDFSVAGLLVGFPLFVWMLDRLTRSQDLLQSQLAALTGALLLVVHVLAVVALIGLFIVRLAANALRGMVAQTGRAPRRPAVDVTSRPGH